MYKNIKNIFFLLPVIIFLFLVIKHYFSEQNLMLTNKSRSTYILSLNKYSNIIPLLKESRKRGREVFFSYRINGSDNDRLFDPLFHPLDNMDTDASLRKKHSH